MNNYTGTEKKNLTEEYNEAIRQSNNRLIILEDEVRTINSTKQNKFPSSVLATFFLFLVMQTGTFLFYGGQVVARLDNISANKYTSLDNIRDRASTDQRFLGTDQRIKRTEQDVTEIKEAMRDFNSRINDNK